ncbi:MAG: molybdenum cofactor guanylyltransferase [candidate division KSB1 bacterium]|nr:molybdenum cofactor guanylyltransferase [candidate division KSB1 bacterium]MDZ7275219.1 molybdenum cofactor guanylyltransferase [candidate division KSB1 bacterium]MDZ7287388.1 molybdenum cofactor guanylyltransferase [candidate division KSB1 bacterium]MDZ7299502.1 molybdenum cofactor guanylyltransferase [candidate division KSB1 bacterium]MDZ7305452.1 molybdenum cofactor guanylyltransferase [candidate division KSB1 bacterium]
MTSTGAAIILAGGKSSRFGRDKALLPWQGTTLLASLATRLQQVFAHVLIVTTPDHQLASPVGRIVYDLITGKNSLGGLHAGLLHSPLPKNFVCACDMPRLLPELARDLMARSSGFDVVIPHVHDRLQPLCAIYDKTCLPVIARALAADQLRMTGWLSQVRVRVVSEAEVRQVDATLQSFYNVNTETDYQNLLAKFSGQPGTVPAAGPAGK